MTTEAKPRGFAAMTPERQREVASQGGKKAHELGRGHRWTPEQAKAAGSAGGKALIAKRGSGHMAEIGRKGYLNSRNKPTDSDVGGVDDTQLAMKRDNDFRE